ncbi:transposable element Tcb2 transposase [Trichonephila clavipes]|nr:transposable element Tcb2 transposase [Trichonephila clavipes]
MISKSPIGLSLCSWNANGILSKLTELKIFIEQHSPDLILIQETHLRPSHINIANYTCYRNDRPTSSDNNRAFGGTLILVKNAINHYSLPTPPMQAIEATIVILTPFDHDPISIVSVYISPKSTVRTDVGVAIVPQTISRHLADANLKSKLSFHALPLTPEHRQLRLQWCQARSMWNVTDWQKVVFSDESRFVLGTDDNHVRVWRLPNERYNSPTLFYVTLPTQLV